MIPFYAPSRARSTGLAAQPRCGAVTLPTRIERTERRFRARTDAGKDVFVTETETATIFVPVDGRVQRMSQIFDWYLDDGREVRRDESGELRITETGEI